MVILLVNCEMNLFFFRKIIDSFSGIPIMRLHVVRVISSVGRAPPLQGGGRRFKPVITHAFYPFILVGC